MKRLILILLLLVSGVVHAESQTYKDVLAGKSCDTSSTQMLSCDYRVGNDLHFVITGIGQPDTSISFYASNIDGDYFGRVGLLHGCVTVWPGRLTNRYDLPGERAHVSPKNGKVYEDYESCHYGY